MSRTFGLSSESDFIPVAPLIPFDAFNGSMPLPFKT